MKHNIITYFLSAILLVSYTSANAQTSGNQIKGDFNGDGAVETAKLTFLSNIRSKEDASQQIRYDVRFANHSIPPLKIIALHKGVKLISEGDLNGKRGDEISVLMPPNNGLWASIETYTFKNGSWVKIMDPVSYYLDDIPNKHIPSLENMISEEKGLVYYYQADLNADQLKFVKKLATLKK